jgi:hypothetical protein
MHGGEAEAIESILLYYMRDFEYSEPPLGREAIVWLARAGAEIQSKHIESSKHRMINIIVNFFTRRKNLHGLN